MDTLPFFFQRETTILTFHLLSPRDLTRAKGVYSLTLLHSEWPKLHSVLAILNAKGLRKAYANLYLHMTDIEKGGKMEMVELLPI